MALNDQINTGSDESRKSAIAEQHQRLKSLFKHPTAGNENTCFHCAGHPVTYSNYKELDWTIRLYYSIKDNLGSGFRVRPSYSYASGHNFPPFQQQIPGWPVSGLYHYKGAPDLLFKRKRRETDVSLFMVELFDLKQGYLTMPKNLITDLPNVASQEFAGLHFLCVVKQNETPKIRSKGLLVKRKDSMSLFTLEADVSKVGLASTTATVQDMC